MYALITASANLPFTIALAMMGLLLALELLGYLIGTSLSGLLDGLIDFDFDLGEGDGSELAGHSLVDRFMGWIHFGKVPVLILLATFLCSYGLLGLLLQGTLSASLGIMLPAWLAGLLVVPPALSAVRLFGHGLARVLPGDETQVVSQQAMIGQIATIVLGSARQGAAAQARVRDRHGHSHYVMLEPDDPEQVFESGEQVLLVAQAGATYRAIRNHNPAMLP
ncbi:MAG: OB-fold-containig protein [Lysobacterales bacterium]